MNIVAHTECYSIRRQQPFTMVLTEIPIITPPAQRLWLRLILYQTPKLKIELMCFYLFAY